MTKRALSKAGKIGMSGYKKIREERGILEREELDDQIDALRAYLESK